MSKYNIRSVQVVIQSLEEWVNQSSETLDNEEAKDYPNDERIDSLNNRIDLLMDAIGTLAEIE